MSQQEDVAHFLQTVCQDKALQDQLKALETPNRQSFVNVAQAQGYSFTTADIDNHVRLVQFYKECQAAIERHQSGSEQLSDWLQQWYRHIQLYSRDDDQDKIGRYLDE
jgi:predicted ribosomally synthesized peptide with nif11-like leader